MDSRYAGGGGEEDGDEAKMVNRWNIQHHGTLGNFWCRCFWGTFRIWDWLHAEWGPAECACIMGPCRQTLSWSNFRSIFSKILHANFKLEQFQKVCFEVPTTMTFESHPGGDMEWGFGNHLPTPKADFWWASALEVVSSVGWGKICRIPQHFLPPSPTATWLDNWVFFLMYF